jgi:hypothetical protein
MPNYIVNPGNAKDILTGFLDMLYFSIQPELVSEFTRERERDRCIFCIILNTFFFVSLSSKMYSTADIYFTKHNVKTD